MKKLKKNVGLLCVVLLCLLSINAITMETAARNAACDAVVDLVDAGSGAGVLYICTAGASDTLASLTMSDPAFGDAVDGVATANSITSDSDADGTGTAAVCFVSDSDGNKIFSGTVGTTGSGADCIISNTSITAGGTISAPSFTYTQPGS